MHVPYKQGPAVMDKEETSSKTLNFRGVKKTMGKTNSSNNAQYHTTKLEANLRKQWVRLVTAFLYIMSVSITAVVLAVYYGVYWTPDISYMEIQRETQDQINNDK